MLEGKLQRQVVTWICLKRERSSLFTNTTEAMEFYMENSTYNFEIYDNYGVRGNTTKIRCHDGNLKNNKR